MKGLSLELKLEQKHLPWGRESENLEVIPYTLVRHLSMSFD